MTGNYYPELASLNVDGFKTNKPQAVNALLKEAENRNLSLLQARLSGIWRVNRFVWRRMVTYRRWV